MGKPRILVFGEVCKELTLYGCRDIDGIKYAEGHESEPGGNGAVSVLTLSYYGNDAVLCSKIGDDTDGKLILRYLSAIENADGNRTDVRFITKSENFSTTLRIITQNEKTQDVTVSRNGKCTVSRSDIEDAFMTYPDHVVLFDCLDTEACCEIRTQIEKKGGDLYIMSGLDKSRLSILKKCAVLSVDEDDAYRLSGIYLKDQETCMRACMTIAKIIASDYIVIRMTGRGYFIYDGTFYMFVSAYDLPKNCQNDGDLIFCSVFVHEFVESEGDIRYTCEYANAAAAAYIARGKASLPTDSEIKKFAERNGTQL